jgi:Tfp pilus assembly protein PilV
MNANKAKALGFGMVELAIGILILGIVFVGIAKLNVASIRYSSGTTAQSNANAIAQFIYQRMQANLSAGKATNYLEGDGMMMCSSRGYTENSAKL